MRSRAWLLTALCGVLFLLFLFGDPVRNAVLQGLLLCARSVVPALFPFLAISGLMISLGFGTWISPLFGSLMTPLFHLPGAGGSALVLGLLGGYPIGARTAAELYRSGALTKGEASRLLSFCSNSNPAFFLNVLGSIFSVRCGLYLWLIHVLSALLTGVFLCRREPPRSAGPLHPPAAVPPFSAALVTSVRTAGETVLSICAFVLFFYTLSAPFSVLGGRLSSAAVGALELFSLTPRLSADRFSFILASACAGWGGLSVLFQTAFVLEGSGLPLRSYVRGKLLQAALSALLAGIVSHFLL